MRRQKLKRWISAAIIAAYISPLSSKAFGWEGVPDWTPQQQELINAANKNNAEILQPGDNAAFDLFFSRYAPDYSYWEVGTEELRSLDTQRERVTRYVNRGNRVSDLQMTPIDVKIHGETGILRSYSVETIRQANGEDLIIQFYAADVFQKQRGRWLHISKNIIYIDEE